MSNITIDELAEIIKNEFENANSRFESLEQKIDAGFKKNETDHENLEIRLSNVAYRFEVIDLQNQVNLLKQRMDAIEVK